MNDIPRPDLSVVVPVDEEIGCLGPLAGIRVERHDSVWKRLSSGVASSSIDRLTREARAG
ncbi:MAG: hypothetical protein MUC56_01400 [Thermoanaerobaculales bacterium]|jgi:hypothetical protein|nr:hypothetical protein [Thermoanaerobaculales bacterium]